MRPKKPRFCGFCDSGVGPSVGTVSDGDGVAVAVGSSCANDALANASRRMATLRFMSGLNSKRCKSCQTLYQSAMKAAFASIIVAALAIHPAFGKSRHCMFRVHAEANARDTAAFASSVRAQLSGKNVAIEKIPRLSDNDVVAF